jgi:hypothetical protein
MRRAAALTALGAPFDEAALARHLFPDQETFRREEQRRFEILDAHWDVPLTEVEPPPSLGDAGARRP